jgi:4'-phosphopantetheinyl transferase EntD
VLEPILPAGVALAATRADLVEDELYPVERAVVENAVQKRRSEFLTGRACARMALAQLGFPAEAVPSGPRGEPRWPDGVVGSITHCEGFRACAVAPADRILAIGIDAEPNQPLSPALLPDIALQEERGWLRDLARRAPEVSWDRLLFSAKESIYKAWFPLAGRWLGFEDAVLEVDREAGTFFGRLLVPGPVLDGQELRGFQGRWLAADGLLATAVAVPAGRG